MKYAKLFEKCVAKIGADTSYVVDPFSLSPQKSDEAISAKISGFNGDLWQDLSAALLEAGSPQIEKVTAHSRAGSAKSNEQVLNYISNCCVDVAAGVAASLSVDTGPSALQTDGG